MPYANNDGVRIHYQVEGTGPALVFQHGFSSNLESWYEPGYVDALQQDYQLVLIDARGHGASDKPHDPEAYALPRRVDDIIAVLDHLDIPKAHFFGYSMGGWIGFGLVKYAAERFSSLVIGGSHPYARSMEEQRQEVRQALQQERKALGAGVEAPSGPSPSGPQARARPNDLEALLASVTHDRPALDDVLPRMTMPCLLFAGEADPVYPFVRECARQIPQVTFFSLPGLGHSQARRRSDLVLPHLTRFLQTVREGVKAAT
jgi:pimeloyl-ACP methyl ester carboxylesterase